MTRAASARHSVSLEATLVGECGEFPIELCTIRNLSLCGALVATSRRLPIGERVRLTFWFLARRAAIVRERHARTWIRAQLRGPDRGHEIRVGIDLVGDDVEVSVVDTGAGIPAIHVVESSISNRTRSRHCTRRTGQ